VSSVPSPGREDVLGLRISAALIDLALLAGVFVVLALAIGERTAEGNNVSLSLSGAAAAVYFGLVLLYYFALEAAIGQTVGKLALNLQVVRADGSRPSAAAIALRTLLRFVDWLPLLYLVGFIAMMATGQRRQRLGDLAAKTIVARPGRARRRVLALPPAAFLLLLIVALSVYRASDSNGAKSAATIRLTPPGAVLFRDDFSNSQSGWYVVRDRDRSSAYVNGRLRITISATGGLTVVDWNDLDHASDGISVTAVLRQPAGRARDELGVLCISNLSQRQAPYNGYALGIGPYHRAVAIRELVGAEIFETTLVDLYPLDAVEPRGQANRIRADCVGSREGVLLAVYANDELIHEGIVPGGFNGFDGIGVYVYSDGGGTTALFDDVVVRERRPASP
jgi:uncharacterized RDD family membrane protein YckC